MDENSESYEFLDLSDINEIDRKEIIKTLYDNNHVVVNCITNNNNHNVNNNSLVTSQLQQQHQQSHQLQPQIVFLPQQPQILPPQPHYHYLHQPQLQQFDQSQVRFASIGPINAAHSVVVEQQHQLQHQPPLQQDQSSTSASETTSIYRSSSLSNCSDSTSDCITPSGSVLNLNSFPNDKQPAYPVINNNYQQNSLPPTYSAVVYGSYIPTPIAARPNISDCDQHSDNENDSLNSISNQNSNVKTSHVEQSSQNSKTCVKSSGGGSSSSWKSTTNLTNNLVALSTVMGQPQQNQQQQTQPQISSQSAQSQTQTNNNVAPYQPTTHHLGGASFNTIQYMPPPHAGQAIYPAAVIPAGLSGSVYVNNLTANVNVGWGGHSGYVQSSGQPQYLHPVGNGADVQQLHNVALVGGDQNQVIQQVQHLNMPVRTRTPQRGRGRGSSNGGNGGTRRNNDYNLQRQQLQQDGSSPSPSQRGGMQHQQLDSGGPTSYAPYGYHYSYPTFYGTPPQNMIHHHPQAQQATGAPLYLGSHVPYLNGPHMYAPPNYPLIYHPQMMPPCDYQMYNDNGEERYILISAGPTGGNEDINHNPSPIATGDAPGMLSPTYSPIYDPQQQHLQQQTIEMQQQMNAVQIYDHHQSPHQIPSQHQSIHQPHMIGPMLVAGPVDGTDIPPQVEEIIAAQHDAQFVITASQMTINNQLDNSCSDEQQSFNEHNISGNSGEALMNIDNAGMPLEDYQPISTEQPVETYLQPNLIHQQQPLFQQTTFNEVAVVKQMNDLRDFNQNMPVVIPQQQILLQTPMLIPQQESLVEPHQVLPADEPNVSKELKSDIPISSTISPVTEAEVISHASTVPDGTYVQQIITKSMSWTNSQQQGHHKKSTASVAVTATPTSTKPTNNKSNSSTTSTYSATQVKNYGVTKTPSSPVPVANAKTTTSTASTVVPQQLQHGADNNKHHYNKRDNKQHHHHQSSTHKKDEILNLAPPTPTVVPTSNQNQGGSTGSWASLFDKSTTVTAVKPVMPSGSNQVNSQQVSTATVAIQSAITPNNLQSQQASGTKPVAKVAPYDGLSTTIASTAGITVQPQTSNPNLTTTPGALSYSAASAQSLQTPVVSNPLSTQTTQTSRVKSSTLGDEWSFKFAEFLTKYKTDFNTVSLKPRGLMNKSNYCYINSILQALIGCPPFYNLLRAIPKQPSALQTDLKIPTINAMVQFASEFSHLPPGARLNINKREKVQKGGSKDELSTTGGTDLQCDSAFDPSGIYKLWNATRSDVEGRQEDAEEFLSFVLNKLNDEMLEVIKLIAKPTASKENGDAEDDEDWQVIASNGKSSVFHQTDYGRTPLSDLFRGETRSRLQREGGLSKDAVQPFYTLQLNIEKAASVKEALELLVGRDQLEGFTCSKTNQEVVAWQQMTLEKLPVVLILHLKWFDYKPDGCTKILKNVEFPVELKIDPKILSSKKSQKGRLYRLFAVVYHDGKEATKGHYITDVYHPGYLKWLRFDDSSVKPISENVVLHPKTPRVPYLLYYRRCDTILNGQLEHPSAVPTQQHNSKVQHQQSSSK